MYKLAISNNVKTWCYDIENDTICYINSDGVTEESFPFSVHMDMKHPDDRKAVEEDLRQLFETGEIKRDNFIIRYKDESEPDGYRHTLNSVTVYTDEENKQVIYGSEQNITPMVRKQQAAEEQAKQKAVFVARASHDIRNPLNNILMLADLICQEDTTPEDREEYKGMIASCGETLTELLNDILDTTRIDSGIITFDKKEFNMKELITDCVQNFKMQDNNAHTFFLKYQLKDDIVITDKQRITQVINNYLSNAIKYSATGTLIKVSLKEEPGGVLFLKIKDQGCGISEADIDRTFDEFTRFNTEINGTGLGLSICKNIIQKLGGRVGVDSVLGTGSTFWFRLPCLKGKM